MTRAEDTFASIATRLLREPDTSEGTGFGTNPGLRAGGKIFAMLVLGELVVKLPAERCAELVAAGSAQPFESGRGRPLKQWVSIPPADASEWLALAEEALAFARRAGASRSL